MTEQTEDFADRVEERFAGRTGSGAEVAEHPGDELAVVMLFFLDLTDPVKGARHWSIELGSPSILQRGGWKFHSVRKGDKVTAVVSPLRNGEPGSLLTRITLPDGRVLGNGGPAGVGPGTTEPPAPAPGRK